jgi:L-lactate dehydrogenase (cytochrome)
MTQFRSTVQDYLAPNAASAAKLTRRERWLSQRMLCLDDFEAQAKKRLPKPIFGYVSGAAETAQSLQDNREAFSEWAFVPNVLADTSNRSHATTLLGETYAAPFGVAPMGIAAISAYRGDVALAEAATFHELPFVLSATSLIPMEDVLSVDPKRWFQAYLPADFEKIEALILRVEKTGCKTLVVTVDLPVGANRENNVRNGFSMPLRPSLALAWQGVSHPRWTLGTFLKTLAKHGVPHFENSSATRGVPIIARDVTRDFSARDRFEFAHIEFIRKHWSGNLVLKGVLSVDDALHVRDLGADAIVLSNHGGRQLDGAISPLRVLPEIAAALPDFPLIVDGGFRRGSDVLKAIALGAKFVFIGRPFNYAAAVAGATGVAHAMALLKAEIDRNMAMLGVRSLPELNASHVRRIG